MSKYRSNHSSLELSSFTRADAGAQGAQGAQGASVAQARGQRMGADYHRPTSAEDVIARNIEAIAALEAASQGERSRGDRAADSIAGFCGSMTFVWAHLVVLTAWMGVVEVPGLKHLHFDPYPFPLLTLALSVEAIFLSTFIMISQNRQNKMAERRNHLDLQVNLLSEQENSTMLSMLDAVLQHLGVAFDKPEVKVLQEATRPDAMARQIQEVIENQEAQKTAQA